MALQQSTSNFPRPTSNSGFCTGRGSSWSTANVNEANIFSQSFMTAAQFISPVASNVQFSSLYSQPQNQYQYNLRDHRQHRSSYGVFSSNYGAAAGYRESPLFLPYPVPNQPEPDPRSLPPQQIEFKPIDSSMFSVAGPVSPYSVVIPPSDYPESGPSVIDSCGARNEHTKQTHLSPYKPIYNELPEPPSDASFSSSQPGQFLRQAELSIPKFSSTASAFAPNSIGGEVGEPVLSKQPRLDMGLRRPSQESASSHSSRGWRGSFGETMPRLFASATANTYTPPEPTEDAAARSSCTQGASLLDNPEIDTSQIDLLCHDAASTSTQLAKLKAFEEKDKGNATAHVFCVVNSCLSSCL